MSSPTSPKAGVLIVNSGILPSAKSILSLSTFHEWYEKIHIRDLFLTDGVKTAYRFEAVHSSSSEPSNDDTTANESDALDKRPFLVTYLLNDVNWVTDDQSPVWQVPVTSDMLPNESGNIFELGDFQMGVFEKVFQETSSGGNENGNGNGPAKKFVALLGVDDRQVGKEPGDAGAKTALGASVPVFEAEGATSGPLPVRSTLFRWIKYSPPGAPKVEGTKEKVGTALSGFRGYLAVHEYDELPGDSLKSAGKDGAPAFVFSGISSLGDVTKAW